MICLYSLLKNQFSKQWDEKEKIAKQIEGAFALQEEMFVPELKAYYMDFNKKREDALKEMIANDNTYFRQMYSIDGYRMHFYLLSCCPELLAGNSLMQIIHIELLKVSIELEKVENCNFLLRHVNQFAKLAIDYNRIGHVDKAILLADLCWAVLDAVVAVKMRLVKGSAQTCIVKQFSKIFSACDLTSKINKQVIDFQYLQKVHQAATEKLQAVSTRSLIATGYNTSLIHYSYLHEDCIMSELLEEICLWCTIIMEQMKVSSVAAEKTKKRWWFW